MSTDLLDRGDVIVTRLVGPSGPSDRTLYQVTTVEGLIVLNRDQARDVAATLAAELRLVP